VTGPLLVLVGCIAGCGALENPVAAPRPRVIFAGDIEPAWSWDGEFIAFQRRISNGREPFGIYIVHRSGGPERLVTRSPYFRVRFSPDGKRLVAGHGERLMIIDVATGFIASPLYTQAGVNVADWSPDGRSIAYQRTWRLPGYPLDSSGIHVFGLDSGVNRPLRYQGHGVTGSELRWTPSGAAIVFGTQSAISVFEMSGGTKRDIMVPSGRVYHPQVFREFLYGRERLVFDAAGTGTWVTNTEGGPIQRWPIDLGPYDEVSPDGRECVVVRAPPGDSIAVLFIRKTDDPTGRSLRQLTDWRR